MWCLVPYTEVEDKLVSLVEEEEEEGVKMKR
jgi:hypothetical protein